MSGLEFSLAEVEAFDRIVTERLRDFLARFPTLPPGGSAHDPERNTVREGFSTGYTVSATAPEDGRDLGATLDLVLSDLAPQSQLPGHPGFMAYVAGSGNHLAALAQMVALELNPFSGHHMMAPGLVSLELEALGWFKTILGLPQTAGGFFTTGSSLATLSAIACARQAKLGHEWHKGVLYVSDQSHHCIAKAARIAGFRASQVRVIASDERYRIDMNELKNAIASDRAVGLEPFMVVGNAGTTNTGAIDDLAQIAELACEEKLWFHCDGAYGAMFCLTLAGRTRLKGIERADSVCFDLHKSFSLPYGTGALLVRDPSVLKAAHSSAETSGSYMPPGPSEHSGLFDFADLGPELSRDWRGLRVWLPIKVLGLKPFREHLTEKLELAKIVAFELHSIPEITVLAEPQLSIVAFAASTDELTEKCLARINARGRVFLSGCSLHGRKAIRICLLSSRAHEREARLCLQEIREALAEASAHSHLAISDKP